LNNITAGVRERQDANRTREAGHQDEIQGAVANTLKFSRQAASLLANAFGVGFIVWLDDPQMIRAACGRTEHQASRDICCHVSTEDETRPHHCRCNQNSCNNRELNRP